MRSFDKARLNGPQGMVGALVDEKVKAFRAGLAASGYWIEHGDWVEVDEQGDIKLIKAKDVLRR